ncbi:MAG: alkaline phosphatase family protein [Chloroflexota bacterium]|nr:alkaline phosphatase family protein [Chloroflexota bacterium]
MRLLIIGLDGATWTVIDPLLKAGRLPNLAHLIQNGTRCVSTAIEPALSPIVWTSLASGKRPEKHGVTHFFDTANSVRCRRLWDILEQPDRPIGIFAWPVTWPPRPVNGFMVPSLFARANDTFPAELGFVKEIEGGVGKGWRDRLRLISTAMRYGLRPTTAARMAHHVVSQRLGNYNALDRFAKPRLLKLGIHLDVYEFLVKKQKPYFTSFYLNQTDAFSHRFWRYYEPHLFPDVTEAEIKRYGDMIPRTYEMADRTVGRLMKLASSDTLTVVISDHGFEAADTAAEGRKFCGRVWGDKLLEMLHLTHQASYVNHRDWIIVKLSREAKQRRAEILDLLGKFRVRELDAPLLHVTDDQTDEIAIKIYDRTHLYRDDVDLNTLHIDYLNETRPFLDLVQADYDKRTSGVHHPDGIAIFCGPGVQPGGYVAQASVLDITPTVLALLGKPIGRDMDGRVLTEAVAPEFLEQRPPTYIDTYDTGLELNEIEDEEPVSEELIARLRDLGYIE